MQEGEIHEGAVETGRGFPERSGATPKAGRVRGTIEALTFWAPIRAAICAASQSDDQSCFWSLVWFSSDFLVFCFFFFCLIYFFVLRLPWIDCINFPMIGIN